MNQETERRWTREELNDEQRLDLIKGHEIVNCLHYICWIFDGLPNEGRVGGCPCEVVHFSVGMGF